jgi:hypothetical protein
MSEDYSEEADSLIDQLKENTGLIRNASRREDFELDKEELEQFILNSSGKLIRDSLEVIDGMRDYVEAAPDAESISSLAELMKASTNAIDTLNKVLIQDKRSATQVGVKKMDIEAKKELEVSSNSKNMLTREDVFKKLLEDAKVIDIEE